MNVLLIDQESYDDLSSSTKELMDLIGVKDAHLVHVKKNRNSNEFGWITLEEFSQLILRGL